VSGPIVIVAVLLAAATASAITNLAMRYGAPRTAAMSDEQRNTREKFFGANKESPSIEKGQGMWPRW
jgi:Ti type entry exclusion protein TrbK